MASSDPPRPIDLNTADRATLEAIEGIGGHAFEIVRYREERGGFTDVEQLDEVPGFTGRLTDAIRRRLVVGPAGADRPSGARSP